jgi:SAM-dependent methyltransferase
MEVRKAYNKLCTEFYDISKPFACPKEVTFFTGVLKGIQGPILEAMCGSGRLLLPLLRLGFEIDGLDNSAEILESCEKRCVSENLKVSLFNQRIESPSLKKYALIFIAVGSFQLITDRAEGLKVLRMLHSHLLPGGSLVLDTFIPWDSINLTVRWYYPHEMELFLEKAGFSQVLMTEHAFEHNPNSIVYQARA